MTLRACHRATARLQPDSHLGPTPFAALKSSYACKRLRRGLHRLPESPLAVWTSTRVTAPLSPESQTAHTSVRTPLAAFVWSSQSINKLTASLTARAFPGEASPRLTAHSCDSRVQRRTESRAVPSGTATRSQRRRASQERRNERWAAGAGARFAERDLFPPVPNSSPKDEPATATVRGAELDQGRFTYGLYERVQAVRGTSQGDPRRGASSSRPNCGHPR